MEASGSQPEHTLSGGELGRIIDIMARIQDRELPSALVMSAYFLRQLVENPVTDEAILELYDLDWRKLDEEGVVPPDEDDTEQVRETIEDSIDDYKKDGHLFLSAFTLLEPRDKAVASEREDQEIEKRIFEGQIRATYETMTVSNDDSDAIFLLSLVGCTLVGGEIIFSEISPKKLEEVQRIIKLTSPNIRAMIYENLKDYEELDPETARYVAEMPPEERGSSQ